MYKWIWIAGGILAAIGGFAFGPMGTHGSTTISAFSTALSALGAISSPAEEIPATADPVIVLWNTDHSVIVGVHGEWQVTETQVGTRMRPLDDEGSILVYSYSDDTHYEFRVPVAGEVYTAFGWICVNQVHQESWRSEGGEAASLTPCGEDPAECSVSYLKLDVRDVTFNATSCWRHDAQPPADCDFVATCKAGSVGCQTWVNLVNGATDSHSAACGSGASIKQCMDAYGATWVCYCA